MHYSQCAMRHALLLSMLLQVACVGTTPPSQFYLLEPLTETNVLTSATTAKLTLSVAPVRIPHYLERAQMVTAVGKNTYQLDELHRWAEGLDDNMTRVMLQDLSLLLSADVVSTNSYRAKQAQLRLAVTVLEFHIDPQAQAALTAQWQVSRADKVVLSQKSQYSVSASGDDMQVKVQALNQCLNLLDDDIATAIKAMHTE